MQKFLNTKQFCSGSTNELKAKGGLESEVTFAEKT